MGRCCIVWRAGKVTDSSCEGGMEGGQSGGWLMCDGKQGLVTTLQLRVGGRLGLEYELVAVSLQTLGFLRRTVRLKVFHQSLEGGCQRAGTPLKAVFTVRVWHEMYDSCSFIFSLRMSFVHELTGRIVHTVFV